MENEKKIETVVGKRESKRDARGVRRNTYTRYKDGQDYDKQTAPDMDTLCDMMRRGIFGDADTGDGQQVRRGRPPKIETVAELREKTEEYIDYIQTANATGSCLIPDVEGFALFIGVSRSTLYEWVNSRPREFSDALKSTLNAIAAAKKQLALRGKIPPLAFATDFNNNHGYTQQQTLNISAEKRLDSLPKKDEIAHRIPAIDPADTDNDEDIL